MWKSVTVGIVGIWLLIAPFVVPSTTENVYNNWLFGALVTIAAIMMSSNRTWERPVAAAAGIWLFISGFVPSVLHGGALMRNDLAIAATLVVAGVAAAIHLRQDYAAGRPVLND